MFSGMAGELDVTIEGKTGDLSGLLIFFKTR